MSEGSKAPSGSIVWVDLTVANAEEVRDFYAAVAGWRPAPVEMPDRTDFNMLAAGSEKPAAGICHALGENKGLPAQWLIYITVPNVAQSMEACLRLGGKVLAAPRGAPGTDRFCVIQDPAGAVAAMYEQAGA